MVCLASARLINHYSFRHSTEPVVEALQESVLNGLPWFDEVQPHIVAVGPFVDCLADQFGSVVDDNGLR